MITEDDLRALFADVTVPPSISPSAVRSRARVIRRNRLGAAAAAVTLVVVAVAGGLAQLPGGTAASPGGDLPTAFTGDGTPMPVDAHGRVALKIPHLYAYTGPGDLCWGSGTDHGVGGMCLVDDTNDQKDGGMSVGQGVIGSIAVEPVVRADFILGNHVVHAQVVGFAKYPRWRTLTARWTGPDSDAGNVLIRGWDASGRQILSVNCLGGCAVPAKKPTMAAQPPSASPVPLAQPARPQPSTLSLSGATVAVLPGVEAWTTKSGICVGVGDFSQCVNDRDHNTDHGFSLGQGVAVTIVGRPVVRAEFTMAGQSFHADVFGFASHPQWRIIAANLNLPGLNGAHVLLKGWDDEGHQILDFDPR